MDSSFGKIYGKPLVKGAQYSVERALYRVHQSVLARVRHRIIQSGFSDRAKKAFSRAIAVEVKHSSLTITSTHPGFTSMMKGRKQRQMSWLTKARAPIPIITDNGELIFRSATVKSMKDGKWVHPGRNPGFMEKVKAEAKTQIKKAILEEIKRGLRNR